MKYQTLKEAIKEVLLGEENLYEAEAATLQKAAEMVGAKVEALLKKKGYMDKKEKGQVVFTPNPNQPNDIEVGLKFTLIVADRTHQGLMRAGTDIEKVVREFVDKIRDTPLFKENRLSGTFINIYKGEAGIKEYLQKPDGRGKVTLPIMGICALDASLADTLNKAYDKRERIKNAPYKANATLQKVLDKLDGLLSSDYYGDIFNHTNIDAIGRFDPKLKKDLLELQKVAERIRKEHTGKKFQY